MQQAQHKAAELDDTYTGSHNYLHQTKSVLVIFLSIRNIAEAALPSLNPALPSHHPSTHTNTIPTRRQNPLDPRKNLAASLYTQQIQRATNTILRLEIFIKRHDIPRPVLRHPTLRHKAVHRDGAVLAQDQVEGDTVDSGRRDGRRRIAVGREGGDVAEDAEPDHYLFCGC